MKEWNRLKWGYLVKWMQGFEKRWKHKNTKLKESSFYPACCLRFKNPPFLFFFFFEEPTISFNWENSSGKTGIRKKSHKLPHNSYHTKAWANGQFFRVGVLCTNSIIFLQNAIGIVHTHLKIRFVDFSVETIWTVSLANLCLPVIEFPWLNVKIIIINHARGSLWVEFDVRMTFCLYDEVKIRLHFFRLSTQRSPG